MAGIVRQEEGRWTRAWRSGVVLCLTLGLGVLLGRAWSDSGFEPGPASLSSPVGPGPAPGPAAGAANSSGSAASGERISVPVSPDSPLGAVQTDGSIPLDPSSLPARQTRYFAEIELAGGLKQMQEAEAKAGESPSAFLLYLEQQLFYQMRVEALASLDQGKALLVPRGRDASLFHGVPYLKYTTRERIGQRTAEVAVPMAADGPVLAMQRAIQIERKRIVADYIAAHNAKPAAARAAARADRLSGKDLPGLAPHVWVQISGDLRWTSEHYLEFKK